MKKIFQRAKSPTPKFFKKLRNAGVCIGAIAGVIIAAPIALPVALTTIAGYGVLTGGLISTVSQLAVKEDE
jgi:hypothetical protein